jgi:hypothetical protein
LLGVLYAVGRIDKPLDGPHHAAQRGDWFRFGLAFSSGHLAVSVGARKIQHSE